MGGENRSLAFHNFGVVQGIHCCEGVLPMRKPRKQRRVMGCELSRQLREPCCGLSMAM